MKLGFSIKATKRNGLVRNEGGIARAFDAAPKATKEVEKVFVTDFDPNAPLVDEKRNKKALVISLIKENQWKPTEKADSAEEADANDENKAEKSSNETPVVTKELTEDEMAAKQLLDDVRSAQEGASNGSKESTLVIPIAKGMGVEDDALAEKRAKLFNLKEDEDKANGAVPILQQNAVPGMDKLADVDDKYRHDVSLRPDELDVHSEAYDSVPIEEFGAAMLRGMGWRGVEEEDEKAEELKPRQKLLGLGATAKPKLPGDNSKKPHRPRRQEDASRNNGLNRSENAPAPSSSSKRDHKDRDDRRSSRDDRHGTSRRRSRSNYRTRGDRDDKSSHHRDRDHESSRGRDRDRKRSHSHDRDRHRDRDRSRRDDREKRRRSRSHSRERSSKSSRR
ncbi:hypothetical protein Poli38472_011524 [Pythium oligandrum]|uniref:Spp2/MOS2 G-patch domain-containing protein n=1 Tax=Pythium oligandrum TaxID=41045 RepID=A0A8K1CJC5_PYTOL|nr:hypothetical protein Poli38472_011524 [Pythium oligandrum]|eukprot:TMW64644.1 hypothetical protein Poli38472_011524 [Pythium oligandrum]